MDVQIQVQEILKKIIDKAKTGGLDPLKVESFLQILPEILKAPKEPRSQFLMGVFTNHEFSKAFFGEYPLTLPIKTDLQIKGDCLHTTYLTLPCWKHRIVEMVLEEDPIKYLEKFI